MSETMELKNVIEELGVAFAEYKKANDAKLDELKKGGDASELKETVKRLEADLQRLEAEKGLLEAKLNRPGALSADPESEKAAKEYKDAWYKWAKFGLITENLREMKDMSISSDPDGGYAVPDELSTQIYSLMLNGTPMRGVSRVISVGSQKYGEIVNLRGTTSGWVGETDARPNTATPQIIRLDASMGEVYAKPRTTQTALEDIVFSVEQFLSEAVSTEFAMQENLAFTSGDGADKPKGFLAYPTAATDDATRPFGTIQAIATGVADGFAASNPADILFTTLYALKGGHQANARWMMNASTVAEIRQWKNSQGDYLWEPSLQAGEPARLIGFPVTMNPDMPSVGANALCVAFGDFYAAYTVVDRVGIMAIRDPYTTPPYVNFYTRKRVGGFLKDSEAVKIIQCAAAA